jgi:hypothetical protein
VRHKGKSTKLKLKGLISSYEQNVFVSGFFSHLSARGVWKLSSEGPGDWLKMGTIKFCPYMHISTRSHLFSDWSQRFGVGINKADYNRAYVHKQRGQTDMSTLRYQSGSDCNGLDLISNVNIGL